MITNEQLKTILKSQKRYREPPKPELQATTLEEALALWNHEDILAFYRKSLKWQPKNEISVFLPCSAWKPYFFSQSHFKGYLRVLEPHLNSIDIFVVSEPLAIVPYCYSDEYPVKNYDYNPNKLFIGKLRHPLVQQALKIFIKRVAKWINKNHQYYKLRLLILPKIWHLKIFHKTLNYLKISESEYKTVSLSGRPNLFVDYMQKQVEAFIDQIL